MLIATIYAWTGIRSIYHYYTRSGPFDVALLQTIIALGCTLVASWLSEPRLRRSDRAWYSLEFPVIARFTRLQFALAVVIFFVTEVPVIGMTFPLFIAALVFVRTKYLPKKYDARTLELIDPLIDLAPIDKTPSTADLLEEGTPPSSPAPQVVSSPVRNRAGSA